MKTHYASFKNIQRTIAGRLGLSQVPTINHGQSKNQAGTQKEKMDLKRKKKVYQIIWEGGTLDVMF